MEKGVSASIEYSYGSPGRIWKKAVSLYLYSTFTLHVEEHGKILSDHTYSTVMAVLEELEKMYCHHA